MRYVQIRMFCDGLNESTRATIDAAAVGAIGKKTPEETIELIETTTDNIYNVAKEKETFKRVIMELNYLDAMLA
ncbi:hypothetical protein SESBI_41577 [Sesbania bispinosa]|nr:hypothetical protein SESBI_41577 [Sesbania bispinosa]